MSMPEIKPSQTTICGALSDVIESIALEEAGLAHIINAEGEKIQAIVKKEHACVHEILQVNESVSNTLVNVIKLQMLLEFKLIEAGKLAEKCRPHRECECEAEASN